MHVNYESVVSNAICPAVVRHALGEGNSPTMLVFIHAHNNFAVPGSVLDSVVENQKVRTQLGHRDGGSMDAEFNPHVSRPAAIIGRGGHARGIRTQSIPRHQARVFRGNLGGMGGAKTRMFWRALDNGATHNDGIQKLWRFLIGPVT